MSFFGYKPPAPRHDSIGLQPQVRQEGFHLPPSSQASEDQENSSQESKPRASSNEDFDFMHVPDAFRKFSGPDSHQAQMDFGDELASLMAPPGEGNHLSNHSRNPQQHQEGGGGRSQHQNGHGAGYDESWRPPLNIFDVSAPSHLSHALHQNNSFSGQSFPGSTAYSAGPSSAPHTTSSFASQFALQTGANGGMGNTDPRHAGLGGSEQFTHNFNSTLPALNSSMRYEPLPDNPSSSTSFNRANSSNGSFSASDNPQFNGSAPFNGANSFGGPANSFGSFNGSNSFGGNNSSFHAATPINFAASRGDSFGSPRDPGFAGSPASFASTSFGRDSFSVGSPGGYAGSPNSFSATSYATSPPSSFPTFRHSPSPSIEPGTPSGEGEGDGPGKRPSSAVARMDVHSRSRSRSRAPPDGVGPTRTASKTRAGSVTRTTAQAAAASTSKTCASRTAATRVRRNNSVSSATPPPMAGVTSLGERGRSALGDIPGSRSSSLGGLERSPLGAGDDRRDGASSGWFIPGHSLNHSSEFAITGSDNSPHHPFQLFNDNHLSSLHHPQSLGRAHSFGATSGLDARFTDPRALEDANRRAMEEVNRRDEGTRPATSIPPLPPINTNMNGVGGATPTSMGPLSALSAHASTITLGSPHSLSAHGLGSSAVHSIGSIGGGTGLGGGGRSSSISSLPGRSASVQRASSLRSSSLATSNGVTSSPADTKVNGTGKAEKLTGDKSALAANEKRRRRRESHNAVERRRRDNINEKISELATLIPEGMLTDTVPGGQATTPTGNEDSLTGFPAGDSKDSKNKDDDEGGVVKANKGMILRKSVEYIRYLQELVQAHATRNHDLEQQLSSYRSGDFQHANTDANGEDMGMILADDADRFGMSFPVGGMTWHGEDTDDVPMDGSKGLNGTMFLATMHEENEESHRQDANPLSPCDDSSPRPGTGVSAALSPEMSVGSGSGEDRDREEEERGRRGRDGRLRGENGDLTKDAHPKIKEEAMSL